MQPPPPAKGVNIERDAINKRLFCNSRTIDGNYIFIVALKAKMKKKEIVTRNERHKMKPENSERIQALDTEGDRETNMKP